MKHVNEPLRPPRRINPELPYPLVTLIEKMLAKRPEGRPQNYDDLIMQIDRIGVALSSTSAMSAAQVLGKPARRTDAGSEPAADAGAARQSSRNLIWVPAALALALLVGWILLDLSGGEPPDTLQSIPTRPAPALQATGSTVQPAPAGGGTEAAADPLPAREFPARPSRADQPDLQIFEKSHEITADGQLRIAGRVINSGQSRATGGKVRIGLVDDDGETVDSVEVDLSPPLLGPGEIGSFDASFADPQAGFRVSLEVSWVW
jgi:hypothetical protein